MHEADALVVHVTAPPEAAEDLARSIVEERRAACVNIIPAVRSVYRWEGTIEADDEALLVVKTTADGLDRLVAHIEANHPYDTPEIIAMPIVAGAGAYLAWIAESVG